MNNKNITVNYIKEMNYPDFVWLVNQWNVPPGSHDTLSRWINYWKINSNSNILEVACTTWFSIREVCYITKASGLWFDFSHKAIENAVYNKENFTKWLNLDFIQADWYEFDNNWKKYSHVIVWWALKFFPDPEKMINRITDFLEDDGLILASPFYWVWKMPLELIEKAKRVFWFTITSEDYKEIMKLYSKFEIIYEERKKMELETDEEIDRYCKSTIDLAVKKLWINDSEIYSAMYNRLFEVRKMSNELRKFQEYSTLILRYRKNIYPNRLVELF